jgi:predicted negative regulator of RcsB-dependent stress response
MATFLSESYPKPKLVENRLVSKILEEQNNKVTFEKKAIDFIKNFVKKNWKALLIVLVIFGLFYWRYIEIKKIRNNNINKTKNKTVFSKSYNSYDEYEDDSEYETSSDS